MNRLIALLVSVAALAAAGPAFAVGLGPLSKEGATMGPKKAFYLTLMNPYSSAQTFRAEALDFEDHPVSRVKIIPAVTTLGAEDNRRLTVVASDLAPGEEFTFRVCAALAEQPERITVHARVCSKLTARRIAAPRG